MQRWNANYSPYSKTHARRMNRKAREQIGGGLSEIQTALGEIDISTTSINESTETLAPTSKFSMIGKGRKRSLSSSQRKRALKMEQMWYPLILADQDFAANPFQAIRMHAENTLLKHIPPDSS